MLPMFNAAYADKAGNIYYLYNGVIPIRDPNELRNDAARRAKVRGRALSAAASFRVERSRTQEGPGTGFGI